MSDAGRSVVLDYLLARGWNLSGRGSSGELWTRGDLETVLPNDIEPGSAPWRRLAVTLARFDAAPAEDLLRQWMDAALRLERNRSVHGAAKNVPGFGRVELDVHLDGVSVREHETGAYNFGRFVMRAAESVKELVKSNLGLKHHARDLLIAGGPARGSVRVRLREPDRADESAMFPEAPMTAEGQALVFVAGIFSAAEESTGDVSDGPLRAGLTPLTVGARLGVARLAEVVVDAGWSITGSIRRGDAEAPLRLGLMAAHLLVSTAREELEQHQTASMRGTLDGWQWSKAELTMITDGSGTIRVAVPMHLQSRVAELNTEPETRIRTRMNVYTRVVAGTSDAVRTSYSLNAIEREGDPTIPHLA